MRIQAKNAPEYLTAMTLKFRVSGTQEDPIGSPISKAKLTKGQQWTPKAQRYAAWKGHVLAAFLDAHSGHPAYSMMIRNIGLRGKPLATSLKYQAVMDLTIHWADDKHGDPEGIFGSIADSIFSQDKYLYGSFKPAVPAQGKGEVEIVITLLEKQN